MRRRYTSPIGVSDNTPIASEINQVLNRCQNVCPGAGAHQAASRALNKGVNITAQTTNFPQLARSFSGSSANSRRRNSNVLTTASSRLSSASLTGSQL